MLLLVAGVAVSIRWLSPALEQTTGWSSFVVNVAVVKSWLLLAMGVIWLTYGSEK